MTMTYDALNRLSSVIETQVGVTSAGYATVGGGITGLSGPGAQLQVTPTDTTELLYFGGTSSDAPMVMERVNDGTLTAYNIGRDHIGTVTHVFTAGGAGEGIPTSYWIPPNVVK